VVERLPSKCKALSSTPVPPKKKKKSIENGIDFVKFFSNCPVI
jgi:hypothetical protein